MGRLSVRYGATAAATYLPPLGRFARPNKQNNDILTDQRMGPPVNDYDDILHFSFDSDRKTLSRYFSKQLVFICDFLAGANSSI